MVGTVVLVADYLPVLNRARATLLQAGYRVLSSTHLPAGYLLARLYLADAVVLLHRLGAVNAVNHTLDDLAADTSTCTVPVVLLSLTPGTLFDRDGQSVTVIGAFDSTALLDTIVDALHRRSPAAVTVAALTGS